VHLRIQQLWNGEPAGADEWATCALGVDSASASLTVNVEAVFYDDPPPSQAVGSTAELWNHEVVELFLFGDGERYLEVELGPHGHHLVLQLAGRRQVFDRVLHVDYSAQREIPNRRWSGALRLPLGLLPPGVARVNAHALHGSSAARRYLSAAPSPAATRPDFHERSAAMPIAPQLIAELGSCSRREC